MSVSVQGAEVKGTTTIGVPMVKGSNNLIKINIDTPIEIDLKTFKDNILPYLEGDDNVVNIEIIGTENFIKNITMSDEIMTITKRTVNGEVVENISLPNCRDGKISSLSWVNGSNKITGQWEQVIGANDEPMSTRINDISYNVTSNETGQITSITRGN